jgi:hypothetical protein
LCGSPAGFLLTEEHKVFPDGIHVDRGVMLERSVTSRGRRVLESHLITRPAFLGTILESLNRLSSNATVSQEDVALFCQFDLPRLPPIKGITIFVGNEGWVAGATKHSLLVVALANAGQLIHNRYRSRIVVPAIES